MLIPSKKQTASPPNPSLSRRVNANSQRLAKNVRVTAKLIKKGEC